MRAPIRKSLRKWVVGACCTLSVALLLQQARSSDAFQTTVMGGGSATGTGDSPAASIQPDEQAPRDPVMQEWQDARRHGRFGGGRGGGGSAFGDDGSAFGGDAGAGGGSGFRSRTSHS